MTVIVNSGQLKWPIVFEKKIKKLDGAGSWSEEWQPFAKDRVKVIPTSAAERIRGHQEEAVITHVLEGRSRSDIDDTMRLIHKGRTLEIKTIIDVEEAGVKNQYLCLEVK